MGLLICFTNDNNCIFEVSYILVYSLNQNQMNKVKISMLFLMLSLSLSLFANTTIDSLNTVLSTSTTIDTSYVKTLLNLSKATLKTDKKKSFENAELALSISDSIYYRRGMAFSYNALGNYYMSNRNYKEAIVNYNNGVEVFNELNDFKNVGLAKSDAGICYCISGDLESGLRLFKETLIIYKEINYIDGLADIYNYLGNVYELIGENESSERSYLNSLELLSEAGNIVKKANLLNNLGIYYNGQSNYYKSLECYLNAFQIYDSIDNNEYMSIALNGIGNVYSNINEDSLALEYYARSLEIAMRLKDNETIAHCITNMASIESRAANYAEALKLYNEAYDLLEVLDLKNDMSSNLVNQGITYRHLNYFKESIIVCNKSLSIAKEIGSKDDECSAQMNLSITYFMMGDYVTAKNKSIIALKLAKQLGVLTYQTELNELLSKIYEKEGKFNIALKYFKEFKSIEDSLLNEKNIKRIAGLENRYEFDKEKQAIYLEQQKNELVHNEKLKQKTQQRDAFIVGFVFILVLVLVIYYGYIQKKKTNILLVEQNLIISKQKEEKELLIKEIHHRVKNNLQIITSLFDLQMNTTNNQETKSALIDGLNRVKSVGLIHQLLHQSNDLVKIDFKDFTNKLIDHITGFATEKPINKTIIIPEGIMFNIETSINLGLIINELLTNTFKYAFCDNDGCSVSICLNRINEEKYNLIISDNGIGLPDGYRPEESTSLGFKLVYTFAEQLSGNISYEYDNGAKFTLVFLTI